MITRATSLMIIIGDHSTLYGSAHWKELIDYCIENRALKAGEKVLHPRVEIP